MSEPERDIQRLWRDQPREEQAMSIDDIRSKAERFDRKVRRRNIFAAVLFIVLILLEAWQVWRQPELLERAGDLLTIAAFIYVAWRFRGYVTTQAMPAGLGRTSSVDFYRQQLMRQRDLAGHPWRYFAAFIPGLALSLFAHAVNRSPVQNVMIAAFGAALFVTVAWVTSLTARKLQREIDELI
jgi:hypothetical protein